MLQRAHGKTRHNARVVVSFGLFFVPFLVQSYLFQNISFCFSACISVQLTCPPPLLTLLSL